MKHLKADVEHRNWRAVHYDAEDEYDNIKPIRLEIDEFEWIHSIFLTLMKIIKRSDADVLHDKSEIGHYFTKTYNFARAYERIFRHLWRKERRLGGLLKKTAKKVH